MLRRLLPCLSMLALGACVACERPPAPDRCTCGPADFSAPAAEAIVATAPDSPREEEPVGAEASAFRITSTARTDAQLATRIAAGLSLLRCCPVEAAAVEEALAGWKADATLPGHWVGRWEDVFVTYDAQTDRLELWGSGAPAPSGTQPPLGQGAALGIARAALERIAPAWGLAPAHFLRGTPLLSMTREVGFSVSRDGGMQDRTVSIADYRFTFFRDVNGIPFTGALVLVSVGADGVVRGLAVAGPTVLSEGMPGEERPTEASLQAVRTHTRAELDVRFQEDAARAHPGARVHVSASGLIYAPAAQDPGLIVPTQSYAYTPSYDSGVVGRGGYLGYPVAQVDGV